MPADKTDFEKAQEIHELLCDVADQGSKEDALSCNAMQQLFNMATSELVPHGLDEFLFRCAIAVQFGPVQSVASDGERAGDADTWGEDSLSQHDKETAERIIELNKRYSETHSETLGPLAPDDPDDENQGMT